MAADGIPVLRFDAARGPDGAFAPDFLDRLRTALHEVGYDYCITIESFDPDMEKISRQCAIWRKLADSPEQLATEGLRFLKDVYRQTYGAN